MTWPGLSVRAADDSHGLTPSTVWSGTTVRCELPRRIASLLLQSLLFVLLGTFALLRSRFFRGLNLTLHMLLISSVRMRLSQHT